MTTHSSYQHADPSLVETWLKGWSLAKGVSLPVPDHDGFRVDVGWADQQIRYVFPTISAGLLHLAQTITQPYIFLKVCAPATAIQPHLPPRWVIQPPGFMMTNHLPDSPPRLHLPDGYRLNIQIDTPVLIATIYSAEETVAAVGRMVIVNDHIIYDRIATDPVHQRRGLGSAVMTALTAAGISMGKNKGILVATPAGKALYETLGWQLYSPYTTAVIPAKTSN